jgi:hypothetical protein
LAHFYSRYFKNKILKSGKEPHPLGSYLLAQAKR